MLFLWSWPVFASTPTQEAEVEVAEAKKELPNVENQVRDYFKDIPVMVQIARCESGFRQWDKNGDVLVGHIDRNDTGVMQINKGFHLEASRRLGMDINTLEGNLRYARYLYLADGTKPWRASASCWGK